MIRTNTMVMAGVLLLMSAGAASAGDARDVVHDETTGTVVHSSSGACVRTQWMSPDDVCAPADAPVAQVAPPPRRMEISREERTVYFAFNQATLSPEMKQRLDSLATKLKSEKSVKGAHIVGYADRIGDPGYNEKLSKKRAEAAKGYLISKGIINTSVADTRWVGSADPVTTCPDKLKKPKLIDCLQGDRRVEVEIDYYPDVTQ